MAHNILSRKWVRCSRSLASASAKSKARRCASSAIPPAPASSASFSRAPCEDRSEKDSMFLKMKLLPAVDNLRKYPPAIVNELQELLVSGASARSDPARKGFYDLEGTDRTFFFHISRINGLVILLAVWLRSASVPAQAWQPGPERV